MHWTDTSSLDLINQLATALANSPVMILGATRPSFSDRMSHWFMGQATHQQIHLKPLSGKQSRTLVAEVLHKVDHLPSDLEKLIVTSSEGNPFYLEEMVKMLIDEGTINKGEENWQIHSDKLAEFHVPATLTGVLQARLERLPLVEHSLIKQASVVGRVFWDQALSYLNQVSADELLDEQVRFGVEKLREKELIYGRDRSAFAGAQEYIFKHAILREVVYESVLKKIRRKYHLFVADWLIEQSRERASEFSGQIAQHLVLAGKDEKAISYLGMAGDDAASRFAIQDALNSYTKALELSPADQLIARFELLTARASLYDLTAERDKQRADIDEMIELADLIDSDAFRCDARLLLAEYYLISEPFNVREQALSVIEMAQTIGDQVREARAMKLIASLAGRHVLILEECIDYFTRAAEIFETAGSHLEAADCLVWLSGLTDGNWKHSSGRSGAGQALIWCRDAGDLRRETVCLRAIAGEHLDKNQPQEAETFAKQALALNREIGDRTEEAKTLLFLGSLLAENQELAEHYFRQSLTAAEEAGSAKIIMYAADALWKYWYSPRGAYQEIIKFCDEYVEKTIAAGSVWDLGYFHALKSITLTDLGLLEEARERQQSYLYAPDKIDDQVSDGWSYMDLARSEIELGEFKSAHKHLQAAAELGRNTGYPPFIGRSLALQAYSILFKDEPGSLKDGLDIANQAVSLFRSEDLRDSTVPLWFAEALKTQARLQIRLGLLDEALDAARKLMVLLETPPVLPKPHEIHFIYSRVLAGLNRENEAKEQLEQAYYWVIEVAMNNLTDDRLRKSWLENVRVNREIVRMWEEHAVNGTNQ